MWFYDVAWNVRLILSHSFVLVFFSNKNNISEKEKINMDRGIPFIKMIIEELIYLSHSNDQLIK